MVPQNQLFQHAKCCRAKCELREQLRPVNEFAQGGSAERLFRDHDRIPGIQTQVVKIVAPQSLIPATAHCVSVGANDELMLAVPIPAYPASVAQIRSNAFS